MTNNQANSSKKQQNTTILESLKKVGSSTTSSLKEDLLKPASKDFMRQLFGAGVMPPRTGEISPGESVEMSDVFSGKHAENIKLRKQIAMERKLRQEENSMIAKKGNELRVELQALMQEVQALAGTTNDLAEEIQIATMQAPIEPGIYHVIFFQKLLEFIKSFRKKLENSSEWLHSTNNRASKKDYWSKYKKHGSKFLLSADHYLTRSAG